MGEDREAALAPPIGDGEGLRGQYYDGARQNKGKRRLDRVDPVVDFDFGMSGPGEGINAKDFFIQWRGALRADVTGQYEITIRCTAAFVRATRMQRSRHRRIREWSWPPTSPRPASPFPMWMSWWTRACDEPPGSIQAAACRASI